jgi:hypothetical protein
VRGREANLEDLENHRLDCLAEVLWSTSFFFVGWFLLLLIFFSSGPSSMAEFVFLLGVTVLVLLLSLLLRHSFTSSPIPQVLRVTLSSTSSSSTSCPVISGSIPFVGAGLRFIRRPKSWLEEMRKEHGDNFVVFMFGFKMFFTFSKQGLEDLYKASENEASFQEATRTLLQLKLPEELLAVRSIKGMFSSLFHRKLMERYASIASRSVEEHLNLLSDDEGEFELFQEIKQVYYRIGFRCWCGEDIVSSASSSSSSSSLMSKLISNFEDLDPEKGFVNPAKLFRTVITKKASERQAFNNIVQLLKDLWIEKRLKKKEGEEAEEEEEDTLVCLHKTYAAQFPDDEEQRYREG